ncbi:hypothetical protein K2Y11_19265 [bacterium]|nr:hypothetical protein [bacterium]
MRSHSDAKTQLKLAVEDFLQTCDQNYWWCAGNEVEIPSERERRLFELLTALELSDAEKGTIVAEQSINFKCGFNIATFGIRIACLGVRNASVDLFRLGILVFVAAGPDFDWRDPMIVISVLEFLAKQLDVNVFDYLNEAIETLNAFRWRLVIQSYRARSQVEQFDWMERLIRSSPALRDFMPL